MNRLLTLLVLATVAAPRGARADACCLVDGTCRDITPATCAGYGGAPQGAGTSCATSPCPPAGACCYGRSCVDGLASGCTGEYQGDGTQCSLLVPPCGMGASCCHPDGSCTLETPADCEASGGIAGRVGSGCTPSPCPGACCLDDGTCQEMPGATCAAMPLSTFIPGVTCAAAVCSPLPVGACCLASGCEDAPEDACHGAFWSGPGSSCATGACNPLACCIDLNCAEAPTAQCLVSGGTPQGPGSTCVTARCVEAEACCDASGCSDLAPQDCTGAALGPGATCATADCAAPRGCCRPDGTCTDEPPADCVAAGGAPQSGGTACASSSCDAIPGEVPDGSLLVARASGSSDIVLTWDASCSPDATDYAVHEGAIGRWYSQVAAACSTGGALTWRLAPRLTSAYYVVAPMTFAKEGSYGRDSLGGERPRSRGGDCRFARRVGCP